MSFKSIKAADAFVQVWADNSRLKRDLKKSKRLITNFSSSMKSAGTKTVKVGAAISAPFILGIKPAADFENQMAAVSTMVDDTEKHMGNFRSGIQRMSVEFGQSTEVLAGGLYDILSASVPAEHAMDVLAVSAKAAVAGMSDTKTAADAITTIMNAYGLSADKAGSVSDWLFTVVKRGKTTFGELAPAIGNVASTAFSAGLSMDELGAGMALLTRNGIQTDSAVTSIQAITSAFMKSAPAAKELAKQYDIDLSPTTLKTIGLAGALEKISKIPEDTIANVFPNIRSLKGILPMTTAIEAFSEDVDAMGNRVGATDTAFKKMSATMTFLGNQIKQGLIEVFVSLGDTIRDEVLGFALSLKSGFKAVTEFIKLNQGLMKSIFKIGIAVIAAGAALFTLGSALAPIALMFGGMASVVGAVITGIAALSSMIPVVVGFVGFLITSIPAVIGFLVAIPSVLVALPILIGSVAGAIAAAIVPIIAVTAAVAVAVAAIWQVMKDTWDKIVNYTEKSVDSIKRTSISAFDGIAKAIKHGNTELAVKILWATIKKIWAQGVFEINEMTNDAMNTLENLSDMMASPSTAAVKYGYAYLTGQSELIQNPEFMLGEKNRITDKSGVYEANDELAKLLKQANSLKEKNIVATKEIVKQVKATEKLDGDFANSTNIKALAESVTNSARATSKEQLRRFQNIGNFDAYKVASQGVGDALNKRIATASEKIEKHTKNTVTGINNIANSLKPPVFS